MTREQAGSSLRWDGTRVARTPRFRLKRMAQGGGDVDGAWWPALASSVVAHAAVELEAQLIKLEKQLAQAK